MNFRTELHPKTAPYKLDLSSKVVTVGSCFSDVIGHQLEKYKVETLTNPFGTIFNPLSACKLLQICAGADVELADSFVENNGRWYSYDFHSSFSADNEEALYEKLDEAIVKTRRFLKKADLLVLTLGTANIFRLKITGETVANCHKLPAANFTRETLLPEEIIAAIAETHSLLRELNPNLKVVLTVSPVRHLKDTLELNSVSKSVLRLATHFLTQDLPDITYFPAYELLLDDLRDYRFYQEDLLHPTPFAETYIWEKFSHAYFNEPFLTFLPEWDTVLRARAHKPFHPESAGHQAFVKNMLDKLQNLAAKIDVTEEVAFFESQVIVLPEPETEETEEETEEEVIPGYFSEEAEELPATEALSEEAAEETPALASEQKKRRKKPRGKKKKPAAAPADEANLTEVGTAAASEGKETLEIPSEPSSELAEILVDPSHEITHYGETLAETPIIKKPLSKSAKRRESRRKKKALAARESAEVDAIQELTEGETTQTAPTFSEEDATVSETKQQVDVPSEKETFKAETPDTQVPAIETVPQKEEKVKPKKGGRKKKNAFPELFTTEEQEASVSPEVVSEEITAATTSEKETQTEEASEITEESKPKKASKTHGTARKAKKQPLLATEAETQANTETIAVPFLPAETLDTTEVIAVPFVPVSELENPAEDIAETPTKPVKKRGRPAKAKATAPERPEAETAPAPEEPAPKKATRTVKKTSPKTTKPKTVRKKKNTPEA